MKVYKAMKEVTYKRYNVIMEKDSRWEVIEPDYEIEIIEVK